VLDCGKKIKSSHRWLPLFRQAWDESALLNRNSQLK
jgi:hypothetical protein